MGIVHTKPKDGPEMVQKDFNHGWVWIVFRLDPNLREDSGQDWHIQGIATSEELAINMCSDENYFIGPIPLDMLFPESRMEWPGMYRPYPHHQ
jgi:hypothetical protein